MSEGWTLSVGRVDTKCRKGGHQVPEGWILSVGRVDTKCRKGGH